MKYNSLPYTNIVKSINKIKNNYCSFKRYNSSKCKIYCYRYFGGRKYHITEVEYEIFDNFYEELCDLFCKYLKLHNSYYID